ncbi:hypothetical protein HK102_013846, partial [Quaeritorhiza haematococci]
WYSTYLEKHPNDDYIARAHKKALNDKRDTKPDPKPKDSDSNAAAMSKKHPKPPQPRPNDPEWRKPNPPRNPRICGKLHWRKDWPTQGAKQPNTPNTSTTTKPQLREIWQHQQPLQETKVSHSPLPNTWGPPPWKHTGAFLISGNPNLSAKFHRGGAPQFQKLPSKHLAVALLSDPIANIINDLRNSKTCAAAFSAQMKKERFKSNIKAMNAAYEKVLMDAFDNANSPTISAAELPKMPVNDTPAPTIPVLAHAEFTNTNGTKIKHNIIADSGAAVTLISQACMPREIFSTADLIIAKQPLSINGIGGNNQTAQQVILRVALLSGEKDKTLNFIVKFYVIDHPTPLVLLGNDVLSALHMRICVHAAPLPTFLQSLYHPSVIIPPTSVAKKLSSLGGMVSAIKSAVSASTPTTLQQQPQLSSSAIKEISNALCIAEVNLNINADAFNVNTHLQQEMEDAKKISTQQVEALRQRHQLGNLRQPLGTPT